MAGQAASLSLNVTEPHIFEPPSPPSICYHQRGRGRNAPPQWTTPLIRRGETPDKEAFSGGGHLKERLRNLNPVIFYIGPPFSWLYGGE